MEEIVIVIMLKNKKTGFLETELGSYNVATDDNLIYNVFAIEEESSKINVHMLLTTERDLEDWEFSAVFDYYDSESLLEVCSLVSEDDSGFNPMWKAVFDFIDNRESMENKISRILNIHKKELLYVYNAIKDLKEKNEYKT